MSQSKKEDIKYEVEEYLEESDFDRNKIDFRDELLVVEDDTVEIKVRYDYIDLIDYIEKDNVNMKKLVLGSKEYAIELHNDSSLLVSISGVGVDDSNERVVSKDRFEEVFLSWVAYNFPGNIEYKKYEAVIEVGSIEVHMDYNNILNLTEIDEALVIRFNDLDLVLMQEGKVRVLHIN